jgi:hypothetical protein
LSGLFFILLTMERDIDILKRSLDKYQDQDGPKAVALKQRIASFEAYQSILDSVHEKPKTILIADGSLSITKMIAEKIARVDGIVIVNPNDEEIPGVKWHRMPHPLSILPLAHPVDAPLHRKSKHHNSKWTHPKKQKSKNKIQKQSRKKNRK